MNIEQIREFCLSFEGVTESFPFDDVLLVFKIESKMFLVVDISKTESDLSIAVKCDADEAIYLRDRYSAVVPAWHFNKKYWNDIHLCGDMPYIEIKKWIEHSYNEVMKKLPKIIREKYKRLP